MNNIYIGNRYVPIFADPVEWDNLREYEPLTIVTYQGTAYTSRQTVPVGTALSNTDYWVVTGNYNAQVEQYRQETVQLAEDLSDFEDDTADNFTAVDTKLDKKANNLKGRKFLFVGDSYIATHSNTCVELACNYLGVSAFTNVAVSGTSFHDGSFLTQVTNYSGDKAAITDIFVIGGLNDSIYTNDNISPLFTAIDNFFNYTKANYPNAQVTVCYTGHALDNAALLDGRVWAKRMACIWGYASRIPENGGKFISNMWQALAINKALMNSDGIHPNTYGQQELARYLVQYILGNDVSGIYPVFGIGGLPSMNYTINADNIIISYDSSMLTLSSVGGQTITSFSDKVNITTNMNIYFNKKITVPCLARAVYANALSHQNLNGYLVFEGTTMAFIPYELENTGWKSYTFSNNGNITIDFLSVSIPINALL